MLLQRYRAIFRYAVGVAVLNPSGGGLFQRLFFVQTGFQEILYRDDLRLSKISVSLKCRGGGLRLAGSGVVAQTQFYYLVCSWGSLVK